MPGVGGAQVGPGFPRTVRSLCGAQSPGWGKELSAPLQGMEGGDGRLGWRGPVRTSQHVVCPL